MAIGEWSDDFKIGEAEIDREHWGLFALINDLAEKRAQGAAEHSVAATIKALAGYVEVHFEHEERLMRDIGYPELAAYIRAHEGLTRKVGEYKEAFEADPARFDFDSFMEFLSEWLSRHILREDMRIAAFHKTGTLPN